MELDMPTKKVRITHRDAGTGRYVSTDYAKKHPKTTVNETNRILPKRKKTPRKR
jgi:hypothetical protein